MKKFKFKKISVVLLAVAFVLGLGGIIAARAVVLPFTPDLGVAKTFGILSDTYYNTEATTTINGDLGYTTPPATAPILSGNLHTTTTDSPAGSIYGQAGTDQAIALSALNTQDCTYTFPSGDIVLATDTYHIPAHGSVPGEYYPGVYCTAGAASTFEVGGALNLKGAGTFLFRSDGALNEVTGSSVATTGGASACDVFWTPNGATTLNYNSSFKGTVIPILADGHNITVYGGVTWVGRALTFGHYVTTTNADSSITVPTCTLPHLTVTKEVIGGGPKDYTTFPLFIDAGTVNTGVATQVSVGAHVVTETTDSNYTQSFSASCPGGNISLTSGVPSEVDKTCTITNTYIPPVVSHSSGGGYLRPPVFLPSINIISTPVVIAPIIPKLPKTGFPPQEKGTMLPIVILSGLSLFSIFLYFAQKKQTI